MGICIVCETESGWRYRWFVVNKDEGIGVGRGGIGCHNIHCGVLKGCGKQNEMNKD